MLVNATDIAKYLKADIIGEDIGITKPQPLGKNEKHAVCFINKDNVNERIDTNILYIVSKNKYISPDSKASYIIVDNPRLAFAKVVKKFFQNMKKPTVSMNSIIAENAIIGDNVSIGNFCVIGEHVTIGDNTIINHNVIISAETCIGQECYIKSGTVIGEDGFGFDFEEDGTPFRLPHLGRVIIGSYVEIGAKCTIAKGTLGDTIIEDHVKIDDQVHIAHNCLIQEKTIITACAEISGSVTIGPKTWIGPNSSIIQKIVIGDESLIGIGAVITKDVPSKKKYMGFEALELRKLIKVKNKIEYK